MTRTTWGDVQHGAPIPTVPASRAPLEAAVLVALYALCVVLANWMIRNVGPIVIPGGTHLVPLAFGIAAPSGTFAAGLTLTVRDLAQRRMGRVPALLMILPGVALSALLSPQLAIASGAAFALSELADFLVYTPLQSRGLTRAVAASSMAGAVVDSVVFLSLAGIPLGVALAGQVLAKWAIQLVALPAVAASRRWLPARDPA